MVLSHLTIHLKNSVVGLGVLVALAGLLPAQEWKTVRQSAADWVVQENSGRVFASDSENDEVVELDAQAGEVRRFNVGKKPTELIIKGNMLIVACSESVSLVIIDLQANRAISTVKLNGKGPYALFASRADDPYAYCICNTGSAWWDGELFQIDLKELKVRKSTRVQSWGQSHPVHVAMSHDGQWIVPDARGVSSPSGADLMKLDSERLELTQLHDHHQSFGEIKAPPFNRYWTLGSSLYSLDLTTQLRTFSGSHLAVHPHYNLTIGLAGTAVVLQKFSDASEIARVPLDSQPANESSNSPLPFDPTIQFDLKNDRAFVGTQSGGHWLDLQPFKPKLEPLFLIDAPSAFSIVVGQPVRFPLRVTNAEAAQDNKLALSDETQQLFGDARIVAGHFEWTPTAAHIGKQKLAVRLGNGKGEQLDEASIEIRVTLPKFDLPFKGRSMRLSPQGQHLVVWGPEPGQESRHPAQGGPDSLAIFDLKQGKMLISKSMPQGIRDIEIDDKHVYIAPASGSLLYRSKHDLSDTKRQFLSFAPMQLHKVSPALLAIAGSQTEMMDAESLKLMKPNLANAMNAADSIAVTGNIAVIAGRIYDRYTGELLRLERAPNIPLLVNRASFQQHGEPGRATHWGRRVQNNGIFNYKGASISQRTEISDSGVSEKWPLAVFVRTGTNDRQFTRHLQFADLVDGAILYDGLIAQSTFQDSSNSYGPAQKLLLAGEKVFVLNGQELLLASVPEPTVQSLPMPLHFKTRQATELKVGATEKVKLQVTGSAGAAFSLMSEYPGLEINENTGELSIDTVLLWQEFVGRLKTQASDLVALKNHDRILDATVNRQAYFDLFGKVLPAEQLATQLPIWVVVKGNDGQEDGLNIVVVVSGPWKDIQTALDKQKASQEKMRAETALAQQRQQQPKGAERESTQTPATNTGATNGTKSEGSLEERISRLEASVRRLEAALDAVLSKIEKVNKP